MNINELTTLNKSKAIQAIRNTSDHPYSTHIEDALKPHEEERIGTGAFGVVYNSKKPNHVYKVYNDPVYHAYAKLAKEQGHIYSAFPKIHALGKTKDNLGVVKMERLKPLGPGDEELIKHLPPGIEGKQYGEWSNSHTGRRFAEKYPHLHSAMALIASKFPKVVLDTHMHNVMKRPHSKDYVLSDPIAGSPNDLNEAWLEELTTLNKSTIPDKIMANLKVQPGMAIARTLGNTKKHGKLGKGVFGVVYKSKNPNTVTKVFRDPAYLDFARYAKSNADDPHLPKIHSIKHDPKSGISVVRMEKLLSSDDMRARTGSMFTPEYEASRNIANGKTGLEVSNVELNPSHNGGWYDKVRARIVNDLKDNHPTVHDSLSNMASAMPYHKFDLHHGNVMYREHPDNKFKHTMVFTDPVVSPEVLDRVKNGKKPILEMMTLNKAVMGKGAGRMYGDKIHDTITDRSPKRRRRPGDDSFRNNKTLLGTGEFAAVYPSTHNKVVKIADDPAYHEFAKYARANPDDPHLPKIHSVKKAGSIAVYRMEKLHQISPTGYHSGEESLNDIMRNARHMPNSRVLENMNDPDTYLHTHFQNLRKVNPPLHQSLVKIIQHFPNHHFDVGPSNMMVRHNPDGTKHIVFTDPIYSKEHLMEAFWHGSGSGQLKGGESGLHLGSKKAAKQALEARIGVPAVGEWDGSREYGKTRLAGQKTIKDKGEYVTGHNSRAPQEDYYPHEHPEGFPEVSRGVSMDPYWKPDILPYAITGKMTDAIHKDFHANGRMKGLLKRGKAKSGYRYTNAAEDSGSISVVVPNGSFVKPTTLEEDGPTNGVAGGHIAGIGIGPDGEPPKKVNTKILRRRLKLV